MIWYRHFSRQWRLGMKVNCSLPGRHSVFIVVLSRKMVSPLRPFFESATFAPCSSISRFMLDMKHARKKADYCRSCGRWKQHTGTPLSNEDLLCPRVWLFSTGCFLHPSSLAPAQVAGAECMVWKYLWSRSLIAGSCPSLCDSLTVCKQRTLLTESQPASFISFSREREMGVEIFSFIVFNGK